MRTYSGALAQHLAAGAALSVFMLTHKRNGTKKQPSTTRWNSHTAYRKSSLYACKLPAVASVTLC